MAPTPPSALLKLASEYGFLLFFGVAVVALLYRYFSNKIDQGTAAQAPIPEQTVSMADLEAHKFFKHCAYYVNFGIRRIRFSQKYPIRAKMYRDMLEIYFDALKSVFKNRLPDLALAEPGLWDQQAMKLLANAVDQYEARFRKSGVPQIVISKFQEWHDPALVFVTTHITTVGESQITQDSKTRTSVLLNTLLSTSKSAFFNAERTLIEINGELTGKEYKGEVIE